MQKSFISLLAAAILFIPLPTFANAATTSHTDLLARIAELQSILATLQAQLASRLQESPAAPTVDTSAQGHTSTEWEYIRPYKTTVVTEETEEPEDILDGWDDLTVYTFKNGELYKNDRRTPGIENTDEYKAWKLFEEVVGEAAARSITNYMTYSLPEESTLAFVEHFNRQDATWIVYKEASQLPGESTMRYATHEEGWGLAMNIHGVDFEDATWTRDTVITFLHEYAHIVTNDESQVDHDKSKGRCEKLKRYYVNVKTSKGCARDGSYITAFVEKFWDKSADKDGDNFVTQYAAKHPLEDIAESFTNFILEQKPTDTTRIRDEKIAFFYSYPELVALRNQIRSRIAQHFN